MAATKMFSVRFAVTMISGTLTLALMSHFITPTLGDCSFSCEALDCPCNCFRDQIRCFNKSVYTIGRFPEQYHFTDLDFANNKIEKLEKKHFRAENIKGMRVLQLASNKIRSIADRTFAGLHHLRLLFLSANRIREINEEIFYGLSALQKLYLDGNQIHSLHGQVFKHVSRRLHLLYLQNNKISHISTSVFHNMKELRTLDLNGNQISILDGRFLERTLKLNHLFWAKNPWNCNEVTVCFTVRILERRTAKEEDQTGVTLHDAMICKSPSELSGKLASKLLDVFDCDNVTWREHEPVAGRPHRTGGDNEAKRLVINFLLISVCLSVWFLIQFSLLTRGS